MKLTLSLVSACFILCSQLSPAHAFPPAPVLSTGQTLCYDSGGAVINCAGTGQDGEMRSGLQSPAPRFTDRNDGTVKDNLTGLIWLKDANCFSGQVWSSAIASANTLASGACGLTDSSVAGEWRLPNKKEQQSLVDLSRNNPALPAGHPFTNVQSSLYWSSSTYSAGTDYAWFVYMRDGSMYSNSGSNGLYVWPVRSGK